MLTRLAWRALLVASLAVSGGCPPSGNDNSTGDDNTPSDTNEGELQEEHVAPPGLDAFGGIGQPSLKLPYRSGDSWYVTNGYNTRTHTGSHAFALDFGLLACDAWNRPILAAAGGTVILANAGIAHYCPENGDPDRGQPTGNIVLIDHGDGYVTYYGHLESLSVAVGEVVSQGAEIGRCGNTGHTCGSACPDHPGTHVHFALRRWNGSQYVAVRPEPMSGHTGFHANARYRSDNDLITPPPPPPPSPCEAGDNYRVGMDTPALSIDEVACLAYRAGFRGDDLVTAIALAGAESEFHVAAHCCNCNARREDSYGLWQIDRRSHPDDFSYDRILQDAEYAANAAYQLRHYPNGWNAWSTYQGARYDSYLAQAHSAAAAAEATQCESTPSPPPPEYALTVNVQGQGSVVAAPAGATYSTGTVVTLTATPETGWSFASWTGVDSPPSANPATLAMNANRVVRATFSRLQPPPPPGNWRQLTVVPGDGWFFWFGLAYHRNRREFVRYGGPDLSHATFAWDGSSTVWREACNCSQTGCNPDFSVPAMAWDGTQIVLFDRTGQTWSWNGGCWSRKDANPAPSPRYGHAMAFDAQRSRVVLFGGVSADNGTVYDDTWEWRTASGWQRITPSGLRPQGRRYHAMAYDAERNVTVLFGGSTGSTVLGDTWEWDGDAWSQRSLSNPNPEPRSNTAMAYDENRRVIILFGGAADSHGGPGLYLSDTWEWDGTTWVEREVEGPSPRARHGMAYDVSHERVILFGGFPADSQSACGQESAGFCDTWVLE